MTWWALWVVGPLLVVVLAGGAGWCVWTAGRLDRMHLRLETARASLDALIQARAALAAELAGRVRDDASSAALLDAARQARDASTDTARWPAQSELSRCLRRYRADPSRSDACPDLLVRSLDDAARQLRMARRIHNDLAARTARLHAMRRIRWVRLAGHASTPSVIDFDDRFEPGADQPPEA